MYVGAKSFIVNFRTLLTSKGAMTLISTLFLLCLSTTVVVCHLPTDRTTRRPRKGGPLEQAKILRKDRDRQQRSAKSKVNTECQEGKPLGLSYIGSVDVTANGVPCRVWQPYELQDHQGVEHNHCRNPDHDPVGVWCYIANNTQETWGYCSVPICGSKRLKVLDFSHHAWGDYEEDGYTKATLDAGLLPESFTLCSAFMLWDYWTTYFKSARLFTLLDKDTIWSWACIELYAGPSYTEYQLIKRDWALSTF